MKQRIRIFYVLIFVCLSSFAQNIEHYYIDMPEEINPLLSKQQRVELLEYYKAAMGDSIKNRYGTQSHLLRFDTLNNSIVVKNTTASTFEMKVFSAQKKTIIGIIKTICAPICHSSINFYDKDWKKMDVNFPMLKALDWLDRAKLTKEKTVENNIDKIINTSFVSLSFAEDKNQVIAQNNSLEFLSEEEKIKVEPLLKKEALILELKKNAFVLLKEK